MKRFLSLLLVFALVLSSAPAISLKVQAVETESIHNSNDTELLTWNGTITQPTTRETIDGVDYYKIYTAEELAYIAQTGGDWLTYNYILANDIVLNDVELT